MQTILHLTDIHFGWEGDNPSELANRQVCLDGMLAELKNVESSWKPTIICLSGDIGWQGKKSDYVEAKKWLDVLLTTCGLTYNELVVCAGNHDVIRSKAQKLPRPASTNDADKVLEPPIAEHFEGPFSQFIEFCNGANLPSLRFGDYNSQLVGERIINGLRFVVLNSAWFSKNDDDKEKLWLGQSHIKYMEANGQLPSLRSSHNSPITITVLHHPAEWLHPDEKHLAGSRPNTWDHLSARSHVLLTGHTHDGVRGADRIADGALHFTGGSAYAGASHFNSFRLIRITPDIVEDRAFEFDPRSVDNKWRPRPAEARPLTYQQQSNTVFVASEQLISIKDYRAAFRKDAQKHLVRKSRILRPEGILPFTIKRPVSVRVSIQHAKYDSEGRLVRDKQTEQTMPFYEAVRQSRRTILFGDLGSGKSTLAAELVIETMDLSERSLAILIPVKALQCFKQFTQRDLLNKVDEYVANDVWLKTPKFELKSILDRGIEVLLIFDGLDELERGIAARLLSRAADLVDNWPTIQVVSTARPIELIGISYAEWKNLHTVALDDSAKGEFIRQEMLADGVQADLVDEKTAVLLQSLKDMTALDSIANSPLVIRLIYPRLSNMSSTASVTLGELLYELLVERLGGWQKRDDKPSAYSLFEQVFPTPEEKAKYLAVLANRVAIGLQTGQDEAKTLLEEKASSASLPNSHLIAVEALSFYEWLGLITKTEPVEFPLQPLAEVCAAVGHLEQWLSNPDAPLHNAAHWRVVSFVAAIARRRGCLDKIRKLLAAYVDLLLKTPGYLPAACYIVVEAADTALAVHTVHAMDNSGYRPLTYFHNERVVSARNIAKTLAIAGETGFTWFYKDYLDPRYPIPNAGSAVVGEILAEWTALVYATLTSAHKVILSKVVLPYGATGEGHFYGVLTKLSLLVPDAFTLEDRFWYQSLALDSKLFKNLVKERFIAAKECEESARILNAILLHRSNESISAARLWLDWNLNVEPPYSVIRLSLCCASKTEPVADEAHILTHCRQRLGADKWMRFARWALANEGSQVAAGAAKVLYEAGERRLAVLGAVAMKAMHDGGYVAAAEKILTELVIHNGNYGIRWLANQVATAEEWHGAYSGWWRVLLARIESVEDGPALIAACVHNLGQYTLPRYPEVREGFARILNGQKGKIFRDALRAKLKSMDPNARRAAALILVTSNPRAEADALFVAVRARAQSHNFDWHEWECFCLTLDFGPSVLSSLKNKLNLLEPHSRAFGLVLLEKGGLGVEPSYRAELMTSLSALGNWHLCREPAGQDVLGAESSFALLLEQVNWPKSDSAQHAAERLLDFHRTRLTPKDEAKCIALRHGTSSWNWELADMMRRVVREPNFAYNLLEAKKEISEKGGRVPLLGLVAEAVIDGTKWKDVVWLLLCDDTRIGGSSDSEGGGMALLEFGFLSKEHGEFIGKAAKEWLGDPRVKQNRWHEAYHWLALLADEFVGIDKETIRGVILHGKPIGYSVTTALIGRLGEVPEKFLCDKVGRHRPASFAEYIFPKRDLTKTILQLEDYGRDSDELHPSLVLTLQECIFLPQFDEATLTSISSAGKPGILISATLRFMYGMTPKMEDTIPLLDRWFRIWSDERNRPHWKQLTNVWRILRGAAFDNNPPVAEAYLAALDHTILHGDVWKLAVAWDILEMRHFLTPVQIPVIFAEYAGHATNMHEVLFPHICIWLSGGIDEATKAAVIQAAESAIVVLNESAWIPKNGENTNTWACLLFPAIQWAYRTQSSEASESVFLRGIRSVFEEFQGQQHFPKPNLSKLLASLDPLLAKTPPEFLGNTVRRGADSLEPSVSAFCRLIEGLSKNLNRQ